MMVSRDAFNPALGGGETVIAAFAKALAARGHEVTIICSTFPGAPREEDVNGVHMVRVARESTLSSATCLEYRRRFRNRVDLVIEDFLAGPSLPFFAPLYVRHPVAAVWHQDHIPVFRYEYPAILLPALAGLERVLVWVHRRSYFFVPSVRSRKSLIAKGADPHRVCVFHPGIDEAFLRVDSPPRAADRARRLVCLGKIRRYKCQHHAILVLKEVLRTDPRASLVVAGRVGDQDYLDEMRALARRLGIEDRVAFELNVTEERKREILRTSRAMLAPAPVEGFGIAIIEASASGLPVIGTEGVPEDALQEDVNGFRVAFSNIVTMAARARVLLDDDDTFDRIVTRATAFAHQFTWERAAQPLLALVRELESHPGQSFSTGIPPC